jgi:phosphotransferase system  glucose/maltose/N-acetylglucosamine-specific IIC component
VTRCPFPDSVPGNKNFTTADLYYLTVNQALDDVKNFMDHFSYNSQSTFQWFVFGGSYAGAMSAWFHVKVYRCVLP